MQHDEHSEATFTNGVHVKTIGSRIPVVLEPLQHTYSLAFALWLLRGSRDEGPEEHGLAHFLEHMFFKGTKSRSSYDIARLLDRIGGQVDAFTTKEYVCFYARVLKDHQDLLTELFADLVQNPLFDPQEMEKERNVIREELRGAEDDPQEFASDRFIETLWPNHGLGRPVGGRMEEIEKIHHDALLAHFRGQVYPENMLITAVGAMEPERLCKGLELYFEPVLSRHGKTLERTPPVPSRFADAWPWANMEQVHVLIGGPGLSFVDDRRYAFALALNVLGSGMSSRLFTRIREQMGLVYNIHASTLPVSDAGLWYIYAGTASHNLSQVLEAIREEISKMRASTLTQEELNLAKEQIRSSSLMSWENSSDRMFTRAKQFVYHEEFLDAEERIRRIEKISLDEVNAVSEKLFNEEHLSALILGNLNDRILASLSWPRPYHVREKAKRQY